MTDPRTPNSGSNTSSSRRGCYNRHPVFPLLVWASLNGAALAVSIFLAIQLGFAKDDWHERSDAAAFYLIWNFATTVLWLVEISFRVYDWRLYHHRTTRSQQQQNGDNNNNSNTNMLTTMSTVDSIELVVEWSFAIIFTLDSIKLLIKWKLKKRGIEEDLVEVVLNIIAFSYITVATLQDYYETSQMRAVRSDSNNAGNDDDRIPNEATPLVV